MTDTSLAGIWSLRDAAGAADAPAFFVKPKAPDYDGAFDDASFLLLPGEDRVIRFRSFDGRMPHADQLTMMHLAATYA